ncbi:cell division protein FtsA [Helicobacter mustelae]|uniref:Cell division protein FtsA n=1 Tax=Helicobacter mustelae (strain ATCC 43772 / CCUG 25715 / CIP 103759 / LMG 18044 / NCTC 12198 / R85-136P) TaxID=679897 RepID=D3UH78_HELM1|nr:cell division protein FtsA [Helicobacter mustelae]CBG39850.1 cell division protein ftsA [Helicobacter mustelae 12198]SQH71359.1 cell division protein FtsA [Helicobacter mustelae]STP12486.1 cell division protein FtsA [Helicobacter mustelae]
MNNRILAIDIGSTKICVAIAEIKNNEPYIIGYSKQKSQGIRKGKITNIELAAQSIKNALDEIKRITGIEEFPKAIVSISGAYTKSFSSSAIINSVNDEITIKEVDRAIKAASYNSSITREYSAIHILPYRFKLDDQDDVEDPVGMSGRRLEIFVHIVAVQKTSLENFKKTINSAGVEIENIVLSSYASSIATLLDDEKDLGAICIDMGGETCDMMISLDNSMRHNSHLSVGAENINLDISLTINTTKLAAEEIKLHHIDLAQYPKKEEDQILEVPCIGKDETFGVTKEKIYEVVNLRVMETFSILSNLLHKSELKDQVTTLVLTGGMSKLKNIIMIAKAYFHDKTIRIARPIEIKGLSDDAKDETNATIIGLLLYGIGKHTNYEKDSKDTIRYKSNKTYSEIAHNENVNYIHTDLSNLTNNFPKEEKNTKKAVIIAQQDSGDKSLKSSFRKMMEKLF